MPTADNTMTCFNKKEKPSELELVGKETKIQNCSLNTHN